MPIIQSPYKAARWLRNPHLQTVLASRVFTPDVVDTDCERIELPDGDFVDINLSKRPVGDVVAIFHGLAGCMQSSYIRGAFQTLEQAGHRPVLMHWRGCSGEPNRLARSYHSGASDDIRWFINYLVTRFQGTPLLALGYSLGANALLKYLGEEGDQSPLSGALAVSPPLVLQEGANRLNQGLARIYQRHLLTLMRRQHEQKRLRHPSLNLRAATPDLDSFWKFDDAITAPLHGYAGVDDYYHRCSARQYLPDIRVPVHILCARDDPFFTPDILPHASELSRQTTLELTPNGGHVGFLQGRERWLDKRVAEVLSGLRVSPGRSPTPGCR
ncbi:MAG: hydrolase [Granulosicoccus sp.]|nr:hydrolase [Granulosicoccus sp.]